MQRLVKTEIDKRIVVTLNKSITADGVNGVMNFGKDNDYPQIIERLVNGSVTSKSAAKIYASFLTGQGFNADINSIVIGEDNRGKPITMLSMLRQVAQSISFNNGFYIHANENIGREVVNTKLVPFKNCRFAKVDDRGYTAMIGVYDNWDNDKSKKFKKSDIVWINLFNLNEAVFNSQVEKETEKDKKFKGQIYFDFLDNQFLYPLSPFDPVYMDSDTEFQIQLFKNRQIRDGFFDKVVFRVSPPADPKESDEFTDGIKNFIGPDGDTVLVLEDEVDEDGNIKKSGAFAIDSIKTNVNDKLFANWEKGLANNIRKAVNNIPNLLIEIEDGMFSGQSGEAITQATNFYNAMTQDDRAFISEAFKNIYSNFADPKLKSNEDWLIKPLKLTEDATTDIRSTADDKKNIGE